MEIRGLDKMMIDLEMIEKQFPGQKEKLLKTQATKVRGQAKLLTPVDKGVLRGDWHYTYKKVAADDEALVYNNVNYAAHREFGHRTRSGGFSPGAYMLKKSINRIESSFETDLREFLRRVTT